MIKSSNNNNPEGCKATRNKPSNVYKLTQRVLLKTILCQTNVCISDRDANRYFQLVECLIKNNGKVYAVKRLKQIHHVFINKLLNQPDPEYSFLATRKGFPRCVEFLKKYSHSVQGIQAINSLLSYYRGIKTDGRPDLSSISREGKPIDLELVTELINIIPPKWKFNVEKLNPPKLLYRSRNGPNGQATLTSMLDLISLEDHLKSSLLMILESYKDDDFIDTFEELIDQTKSDSIGKKLFHSRLSLKREGGGKNRIFAIVDYWTQCILKPLHNQLIEILSTIENDCTYDQGKGVEVIKAWTIEANSKVGGNTTEQVSDPKGSPATLVKETQPLNDIYCYDLSSASDRIPMYLQKQIIAKLTGNEGFASNWENLMVNRDFHYKGNTFKWAVGQPLGAYSSWPSFTLAHHLMVMLANNKTGENLNYYLLGDDIIIKGHSTARNYLNILDRLGIDVNFTKSMCGNAAEFAKRNFFQGVEVSPIPVKLIQSFVKDPLLITEVFNQLVDRAAERKSFRNSVNTVVKDIAVIIRRDPAQLLRLVNNPITGAQSREDLRGIPLSNLSLADWPVLDNKIYQALYSIIKYKYLIRQYKKLQPSEDAFASKLRAIELPGINQEFLDYHPVRVALLHAHKMRRKTAHLSVGAFWSQSRKGMTKEILPEVSDISLDVLTDRHLTKIKHTSKIIDELYEAAVQASYRLKNLSERHELSFNQLLSEMVKMKV